MGVVSVRIPDELQKELERANAKISEEIRKHLQAMATRLLLERRRKTLEKYQTRASKPVAEIVRETRQEH